MNRIHLGAHATAPIVSAPDAAGWYTSLWYPLRFDLGPCTTRTCGCVPAGRGAEAAYQCCSGTAGPYSGPDLRSYFNVTCQ